jgi:Family of unknown function (DUF6152)
MKIRVQWIVLALFAACLLMTPPMFGHHSTAMYDMANPVTVTGTVTKFDWTNPHAHIYLDVKNDKGEIEHWDVEMMSLNHLKSYGWTHSTVQPGDVISCTGGKAKSGSPAMISSVMKLGDGRTIKS